VDYIERETGQFPLSIGTSLALEGLFGVHPNQPRQPSGYGRIKELWVNVRTLIRNCYAAMTVEHSKKASIEQTVQVLFDEIQSLPDVLRQQASGRYNIRLYQNDLSDLKWQFPHAKHKTPKTEKQRHYNNFEMLVLKLLLDLLAEEKIPVLTVTRKPSMQQNTVALLTHHPHELLWRFQFERLFLLESHTGKVKSVGQWSSKLNGVKEEDQIPVNEFTLQLFGDGSLLDSFPKKLRDEVKQLATVRKWSAITTQPKIQSDILRYGGEGLKSTFRELSTRTG
jgi:hypothetical protein